MVLTNFLVCCMYSVCINIVDSKHQSDGRTFINTSGENNVMGVLLLVCPSHCSKRRNNVVFHHNYVVSHRNHVVFHHTCKCSVTSFCLRILTNVWLF